MEFSSGRSRRLRLVCDYFHLSRGGDERGLGFTSLHLQDETQSRTKACTAVKAKYGILDSGNKAVLFPSANGVSSSPAPASWNTVHGTMLPSGVPFG